MNICIFDTETTSLEKPFCYNIGYIIANENGEILLKREYVIEQIWHNSMLFTTSYYAGKKPFYVNAMRARKITLEKFGYVCQQMIRDFKQYGILSAYAYNSSFDEKVFEFNCDWFKCNNPFDTVEIFDIRGLVHKFIAFEKDFQDYCENNNYFTESGNYSTTAETIFRYITKNSKFEEAHTALDDSEIEKEILFYCIEKGGQLETEYKTYSSIPRKIKKEFNVFKNKELVFTTDYMKMRVKKKTDYFLED